MSEQVYEQLTLFPADSPASRSPLPGSSSGTVGPTESGLGGMADGIPGRLDGDLDFLINHYWDVEPDIPRVAAGIPHRVDKLKALGNAVVPQQFYLVFKSIAEVEEQRITLHPLHQAHPSGAPCPG